ncbi:MAG: alanine racemase [Homoserinimonas sp.]|jgi:alanine racemase|nr:alanine racemase [Homoserinimonas sp.]
MTRPMREAVVDLSAISHNVETLRRLTDTVHTMAVVKAAGYGHGAIAAAQAALDGGADWLGVADIAEAQELRDAGITSPVLAWLHDPAERFDEALTAGIDIGVSSLAQLDAVAAAASRSSVTAQVHLKVDTGLSRNGLAADAWSRAFDAAAEYQRRGLVQVRGIFSHLSNASAGDDLAQTAIFEWAVERAAAVGLEPEVRHLAATCGALRTPQSRFDLVRFGIGIYGLSPLAEKSSAELGLRPALELSASIVSVKKVPTGSGVSYGFSYRTQGESTLALVPLGYGDGIPRHASNRAPVAINGKMYRIAGRVAMDQFVVDLGADEAAVGDRAVLFGDPTSGAPSADDWATACDTINYEIVTRIGGRIQRTVTL